jgi:uncharacterized protein
MPSTWEAYLDIETTGLSPDFSQITVIGIYLTDGVEERFVQLVGEEITADAIMEAVKGVTALYTYNGRRFDLPFIYACCGVNLEKECRHIDLMNHCWQNNLFGGLKAVERSLGIDRNIKEVDGLEAIRLWWRYVNDYDKEALKILLDYNREDVVNLKTLKHKLASKRG